MIYLIIIIIINCKVCYLLNFKYYRHVWSKQ